MDNEIMKVSDPRSNVHCLGSSENKTLYIPNTWHLAFVPSLSQVSDWSIITHPGSAWFSIRDARNSSKFLPL